VSLRLHGLWDVVGCGGFIIFNAGIGMIRCLLVDILRFLGHKGSSGKTLG